MSKSLDLVKHLAPRNAISFASIPGAFIFTDETPAHRFTTVIAPILKGEYCLVVLSRDYFDEGLATAVLAFVVERESTISFDKPLVLLDTFACSQYLFNTVALLSPAAVKQFEHEDEMLSKRAFLAFPIYRCELSGDESPELIDTIRHDVLPSLDWKRIPCPNVMMSSRNCKNKTGSQWHVTKLATALYHVERLYEAEDSWVALQNYAGRRCRIAWLNRHYTVEFPSQDAMTLDQVALIDSIKEFLLHDQIREV